MKFVSVSLIKDEADIIELFIRINSRVIDHFFIVDNGSSDNTVKILSKLKEEGFNITLFKDPMAEYDQSLMTTKALRTAHSKMRFDWAFMLDADEFINIDKQTLEDELSTVTDNQVASFKWSTWIPNEDLWFKCDNPLWTGFRRKSKETEHFEKVIVPYRLAPNTILAMGNHSAFITYNGSVKLSDGCTKLNQYCLKSGVLDHVPVRSGPQIILKVLIGSIKAFLKKNREPYECYHWDNIVLMIRGYQYQVDDLLLRYLALSYLTKTDEQPVDEVDEDSRIGKETDKFKYAYLNKINERSRFFNSMISLTSKL